MGNDQQLHERPAGSAPAPRPRVQSVARAVGILLAVAQSENGVTASEISERVRISRQASYHLLHTLVRTGMLRRHDRSRYVLGLRVGTLAEAFARQLAPSEHLAPIVRELSRETGEAAYAAGWSSGEVTILNIARGTNLVQASEVPQGFVGNGHARASGKLLLAFATPDARDAYLATHPMTRLTPNTITKRRDLERAITAIRNQGYAIDDEEVAIGLCCLAVPFDAGYSPFVLALSAPRDRFVANQNEYLGVMRRLVETTEISGEAAGRRI